ncbi:MAG: VWA domain-containing protein, partial [Acidobacteriota bacterium]
MNTFRTLVRIVGLVALVLALVTPAVAQDEQPGVFGEVIDVRVINLEVVVTDRDGNRVTGLSPDDFILTIDGREAPVEYFTEVLGGTAVPAEAASSDLTVPAMAPGTPVGTSYLVFIDEFFGIAKDRNRLIERMIEQLPLLTPEDRMAIVAFDGRDLDMLSSWSQSPDELERILMQAKDRPSYGLQRRAERRVYDETRRLRDGLEAFDGERADALSREFDLEEENEAALIQNQVERVVMAATATLRGFGGPSGRKVMMLLAGGWPYNPAELVTQDPDRTVFASRIATGDELYSPLIDTANRLSFTLYTVDMPGLDAGTDVDVRTNDIATASLDRRLGFDRERNLHLTLNRVAEETGGKAMINSSSRQAFETVVQDTRSYYSLGFTPDWVGDDERRDVRLVAKNDDYEVRARGSYSDLSRETEVSMMVESTLLFGNAPSAGGLPIAFGEAERKGWGKVAVPITVALPVHDLTFLPTGNGWTSEVELRVAVLDDEGNIAEIPVIPLTLTLDAEPTEQGYSSYKTILNMRREVHDIVVSVYDKPSGRILSNSCSLDPTGKGERR